VIVPRTACLAALAIVFSQSGRDAPVVDCRTEAQILSRAQSELPRLDVASPHDRPPYCITLETIMAFAGRVKAHVGRCPNSEFAAGLPEWTKTQTDYSRVFVQHRCKRTL
jgi:hypothetical protein